MPQFPALTPNVYPTCPTPLRQGLTSPLAVSFGTERTPAEESGKATESGKQTQHTPPPADSFLKITAREAAKNGAVIGLTLLLAPLLGPALVGAVGGGGLMSGMLFGVVVPSAVEYGLNRHEGKLEQFKLWAQQKIYSPAKQILTPLAESPIGRILHNNPKQWLATTLEKLNPEALLERVKARQLLQKTEAAAGAVAGEAAKATAHHPLSPQRFVQLFRQHLTHLGWGPAMLVTLHGLLAGIRNYFSLSQQFNGAKSAFGKGVGSGLTHTAKTLVGRGGLRGLRVGLFLRQALIANTVVWGAMKGISLLTRLMYGKSVAQLIQHAGHQAKQQSGVGAEKAAKTMAKAVSKTLTTSA